MRYAAFFRGINVGGNHPLKMADLKRLFEDCGFQAVQTVIQSGNVLFDADGAPEMLPVAISRAFLERFGFESEAAVRSGEEIDALLKALPFTQAEIAQAEAADPDVEHVYVYLSNRPVDSQAAEELQNAYGGEDKLAAGTRELYLLCRHSVRDSKLAAALSKLDPTFTNRNLNTLKKIQALIAARG